MQEDGYARRNFILNIFRNGVWGFGSGFMVESTIITIFLTNFTNSKILIALLTTVPVLSAATMPVISEYLTKNAKNKKFLVSILLFFHQLCWLGIALFAFFSKNIQPRNMVIAFFALYAMSSVIMGMINPINYAFLAKIMPKKKGAFYGIGISVLSACAIAGAVLAKKVLESYSFPVNYAMCLFIAFFVHVISIIFIMASKEREIDFKQPEDNRFHVYLKDMFGIIKKDENYRNLLIVQIIISLGAMGSAFYAVYVKSTIQMTPSILGVITIFAVTGQMVSSSILGFIGDKRGHRFTYISALGCSISAAIIALCGRDISHFYIMFFLGGAAGGASEVAGTSLIMEMAGVEHSGKYFAVNSTFLAPFTALAPIIGGLLIENISYRIVFIFTLIFLLGGLALFLSQRKLKVS